MLTESFSKYDGKDRLIAIAKEESKTQVFSVIPTTATFKFAEIWSIYHAQAQPATVGSLSTDENAAEREFTKDEYDIIEKLKSRWRHVREVLQERREYLASSDGIRRQAAVSIMSEAPLTVRAVLTERFIVLWQRIDTNDSALSRIRALADEAIGMLSMADLDPSVHGRLDQVLNMVEPLEISLSGARDSMSEQNLTSIASAKDFHSMEVGLEFAERGMDLVESKVPEAKALAKKILAKKSK